MTKPKKPKKKHNPLKNQQMMAQTNLDKIRASSWYAGGSWQDSIGTIAGNFDYPDLFSPAIAKRIMEQKNQWSCILIAFLDNGIELYTKSIQLPDITDHVFRQDVERIVEPQMQTWNRTHDRRQLISISWFMVPAAGIDLISASSQIADILESHGAADPLLCELASDQRWNEIHQRDQQEQAV